MKFDLRAQDPHNQTDPSEQSPSDDGDIVATVLLNGLLSEIESFPFRMALAQMTTDVK